MRNLDDILRLDNPSEQMVSQDLLDEARVDSSLIDAEDATALDDGRESIVARREERDVLLRCEELGGVLDLTEQPDERRERFLAREHCCEVLCYSKGSSGCCQEKVVRAHLASG